MNIKMINLIMAIIKIWKCMINKKRSLFVIFEKKEPE